MDRDMATPKDHFFEEAFTTWLTKNAVYYKASRRPTSGAWARPLPLPHVPDRIEAVAGLQGPLREQGQKA
jgi:hypothetical protein